MRIIAGRYKGRRLYGPASSATRATPDRVREALFSALGDIGGGRLLDLFAGTGAIGIEGLSRGVRQAIFVERERRALAVIKKNLALVKADPHAAVVVKSDVAVAVKDLVERGDRFDLIFCDPPYAYANDIHLTLAPHLIELLDSAGTLVLESAVRDQIELQVSDFDAAVTTRRYGDTLLTFIRRQ